MSNTPSPVRSLTSDSSMQSPISISSDEQLHSLSARSFKVEYNRVIDNLIVCDNSPDSMARHDSSNGDGIIRLINNPERLKGHAFESTRLFAQRSALLGVPFVGPISSVNSDTSPAKSPPAPSQWLQKPLQPQFPSQQPGLVLNSSGSCAQSVRSANTDDCADASTIIAIQLRLQQPNIQRQQQLPKQQHRQQQQQSKRPIGQQQHQQQQPKRKQSRPLQQRQQQQQRREQQHLALHGGNIASAVNFASASQPVHNAAAKSIDPRARLAHLERMRQETQSRQGQSLPREAIVQLQQQQLEATFQNSFHNDQNDHDALLAAFNRQQKQIDCMIEGMAKMQLTITQLLCQNGGNSADLANA
ncbi:hypothetical protein ACLKA6_002030 [Drosophila palustris]